MSWSLFCLLFIHALLVGLRSGTGTVQRRGDVKVSFTILFIALAHAIPVVLTSAIYGKPAAFVVAVVMSIVAFGTGSISYVVWDLIAIWAAVFLYPKE